MVPTDLTPTLTRAGAAVLALTTLGALIALVDPRLVASRPPYPTLTGSPDDGLAILAANTRTLAIPFAFASLGLAGSRVGRLVGDLGVCTLTAISTLNVGLALGRWGLRLVPYVPQLPLEWTALAVAVSAWLLARKRQPSAQTLIALAAATGLLLIASAAIETWATPHRQARVAASTAAVPPDGSRGLERPADFAGARAGGRRTTINPRFPGGIT